MGVDSFGQAMAAATAPRMGSSTASRISSQMRTIFTKNELITAGFPGRPGREPQRHCIAPDRARPGADALAAGVLYPFFGLLLSPVVAAAAMALSSVGVIANARRLQGVRVD